MCPFILVNVKCNLKLSIVIGQFSDFQKEKTSIYCTRHGGLSETTINHIANLGARHFAFVQSYRHCDSLYQSKFYPCFSVFHSVTFSHFLSSDYRSIPVRSAKNFKKCLSDFASIRHVLI